MIFLKGGLGGANQSLWIGNAVAVCDGTRLDAVFLAGCNHRRIIIRFVLKGALPNGKAQITVNLLTTRALGFAQSVKDLDGNTFLETPTNFGVKAQEVIAGKKPSIGPVIFSVTFSISTPGARLPDLLDVINDKPENKYAPIKMSFKSTTFGKCPSGIKARLEVHQVAATNDSDALVFTKEKVKIIDSNGGQCDG